MVYLIGGAPRVGKTILCQRIAARLAIGWISTDLLRELLKVQSTEVPHVEWNAFETIAATAEWFYPYLERFVWGVSSFAEYYVIEGVDFLPAQVAQLSTHYPIRPVFLGCSKLTLEHLDRFPGRSRGYAYLSVEERRKIVQHVPTHSEIVRREAKRYGYPYIDMVGDFEERLHEAEVLLTDSAVLDV